MPSFDIIEPVPLLLRMVRLVVVDVSVELLDPMPLDEPVPVEPELDGDVVVPMVPLPVVLDPVLPLWVGLVTVPGVVPDGLVGLVAPVVLEPTPVDEPVVVVLDPVPVVPLVPVLPLWVGLVTVPGVVPDGLVGLVAPVVLEPTPVDGLVGLVLCAPAFMPTATRAAAATAARPMRGLFMLIS